MPTENEHNYNDTNRAIDPLPLSNRPPVAGYMDVDPMLPNSPVCPAYPQQHTIPPAYTVGNGVDGLK